MSRIYTDAFDYGARKNLENVDGDLDVALDYVSRIRLDALLFDTIVVTDAQLAHSAFFSDLAFEHFDGRPLWHHIPNSLLEVRMRSSTLSESMSTMFYPKGGISEHLFTYIDPLGMAREALAKETVAMDAVGVATLLSRSIDDENCQRRAHRAREAWRHWQSVSSREEDVRGGRLVNAVQWRPLPSFVETVGKANRIIRSRVSPRSSLGATTLEAIDQGKTTRAAVVRNLLSAERDNRTKDEIEDLEKIDLAYSAIYNTLAAIQHDTNFVDINIPGLLKNNTINCATSSEVPLWFWPALARMHPDEFDQLRRKLSPLRRRGDYDIDARNDFAAAMVDAATNSVTSSERLGLEKRKSRLNLFNRVVPNTLVEIAGLVDATVNGVNLVSWGLFAGGLALKFPERDAFRDEAVMAVTQHIGARLKSAVQTTPEAANLFNILTSRPLAE